MATKISSGKYLCFIIVFIITASLFLSAQELAPWQRMDPGSGFGDISQRWISAMAVHDNTLVAGTAGSFNGFNIWRYNGVSWTRIGANGLGSTNNLTTGAIKVFNSRIHVSNGSGSFTPNPARVFAYNGTAWNQINSDGFGNPSNRGCRSMATDGTYLFAGTYNDTTGCEVWRYDGANWTRLSSAGFGNGNNREARSMAMIQGVLYTGTVNSNTGGEIWRYNGSPDNWTRVAVNGIDNANGNTTIRVLASFRGRLYAGSGSWNGTQVFRYNNSPDSWTQVNTTAFAGNAIASHSMFVYADRLFVGTNAWSLSNVWAYDGTAWTLMNGDGFGDNNNISVHAMAEFRNQLYAGAHNNNTGAQMWRTYFTYRVRASVDGEHGRVEPARDRVRYRHDTVINFYPEKGYVVGTITDNGKSMPVTNPYQLINVKSNHNIVVTFIKAPPRVKFITPQDAAVVSGTVPIQVEAKHEQGISRIDLHINGEIKTSDADGSPLDFQWDTLPLTTGAHTLKAVAYSLAGTTGEAAIAVEVKNITLALNADTFTEKAWLVNRYYGRLTLNVNNIGGVAIGKFLIHRKDSGDTWTTIAEVPGSQLQGTTLTYLDGTVLKNKFYVYYIEVVDTSGRTITMSNTAGIE